MFFVTELFSIFFVLELKYQPVLGTYNERITPIKQQIYSLKT